jgi:hydrogenase maturation protein HypF
MDKACHIIVTGLVQGVGFRPFVYRIALRYNLSGWVRNTNENVEIFVQGPQHLIEEFINELSSDPPVASHIHNIIPSFTETIELLGFQIRRSENTSERITEISPDIAVCDDCLEDMHVQHNRVSYPFVNCTNCGPRFTIINDLPYDRQNTSMKVFPMCNSCRKEYEDVNDRRFHAQPVACSVCGPQYTLYQGSNRIEEIELIIASVADFIEKGGILAIKGLGGYHLACDATNEVVVTRLRVMKNREGKPLAVMFRTIEMVMKYAEVNSSEENSLLSQRKPIVLLRSDGNIQLAQSINVGLNTIGAMLPYLPFHHLLFSKLNIPAIVLTSGNISDEPIIIDDRKAIDTFLSKTGAVLVYNREIVNRADDSVVRIINNSERVFRRSRGFAPSPIILNIDSSNILATGAELVNTFCIGNGMQAIMSQYIGDLQNAETTSFYLEALTKFQHLFRMKPEVIATDLHPDYFVTRFAETIVDSGNMIKIQHHHAHIASCMAEHHLDEPVMGVAMDGTGFGTDGNTWGAEFLYCDLATFERETHFDYVPLPGGDKGIEEPWRMTVSYLYRIFGEEVVNLNIPFIDKIGKDKVDIIVNMISSGTNCPLVSSAGRLFDAVSALLCLCHYSTFSSEAPMRLESIIELGCSDLYPFTLNKTVNFNSTFTGILADINKNIKNEVISAKFHNTIIAVIYEGIIKIKHRHPCNKIVLSGGTFQNKYLLEGTEMMLRRKGFEVFSHHLIPTNDGGISLGQLAIAAKRRELGLLT